MRCGYDGTGNVVHVEGDEKYCVGCAAAKIRELKKHRFQLAAALGYEPHIPGQTPVFDRLLKQVRALVTMRDTLNKFRSFMKEV